MRVFLLSANTLKLITGSAGRTNHSLLTFQLTIGIIYFFTEDCHLQGFIWFLIRLSLKIDSKLLSQRRKQHKNSILSPLFQLRDIYVTTPDKNIFRHENTTHCNCENWGRIPNEMCSRPLSGWGEKQRCLCYLNRTGRTITKIKKWFVFPLSLTVVFFFGKFKLSWN